MNDSEPLVTNGIRKCRAPNGSALDDKLGVRLTVRDNVNPDLIFMVVAHQAGLFATDCRNLQQVIRLQRL